jgi:hypothetical protein
LNINALSAESFRSNMSGANRICAVELKRADGKPGYLGAPSREFY